MTEEKRLFVLRLIEVVTALNYPEHGRQTQLAAHYKVTQGAARKWFAGEAMPSYEICVDLCKRGKVHYDWLMTGRPPKFLSGAESPEILALYDRYRRADPQTRQLIDLALQNPDEALPDEISPSVRNMINAIRISLPGTE